MGSVLLGIAILAALVLAALTVPLTVAFRVDSTEEAGTHLSFRWLFGLVRFRMNVPGPVREKPPADRKGEKKQKRRTLGGGAVCVYRLLKESPFRRSVAQFIKNLWRAIEVRDLFLRLRVGLGDPADTGRLWALLGPVAGFASSLHHADVRIEPEFVDTVLVFESRGALRLVPLQCLALTIAFAASPTMVRAWFMLHQSHG